MSNLLISSSSEIQRNRCHISDKTMLMNFTDIMHGVSEKDTFQTQISRQLLYELDSCECFELAIRKNTRSCTHGKLMITS